MKKPGFADLAHLPEDERIVLMAKYCKEGNTIACVTDADPKKAERYIEKMVAQGVRHTETAPGPIPKTVLLGFAPELDS